MATRRTTKKTATKKAAASKRAPAKKKAPAKATAAKKPRKYKKPGTTTAAKKTAPKKAKAEPAKKLSALAAAANVLGETKDALNAKEMIEEMSAKGYWTSPEGRTPHMTLYAALIREIKNKGRDSRFKKTEPGRFTLNGKG